MTKFCFGGSAIKSSVTAAQLALSVVAITLARVPVAHAGSVLTFVASTGNDSNSSTNCAATSPCRTFSAAYGVTLSGGEIIALDSADFGTLTITMPISITGAHVAEITVPGGGTGVDVNVPGSSPGNAVLLKNIQINGDFSGANTDVPVTARSNGGFSGANTGIRLTAGSLILQNSSLKFLTTGMTVAANTKSDLIGTDIIGNTTGISTSGTGTNFDNFTGYGPTQVRISGGSVVDNTTGFTMNTPGNDHFQVFDTVLLNTPITTIVAGNGTLVTCTGIVAVTGSTPPCNQVGVFGNSNFNVNAAH